MQDKLIFSLEYHVPTLNNFLHILCNGIAPDISVVLYFILCPLSVLAVSSNPAKE